MQRLVVQFLFLLQGLTIQSLVLIILATSYQNKQIETLSSRNAFLVFAIRSCFVPEWNSRLPNS
jgi:hypothetical protein